MASPLNKDLFREVAFQDGKTYIVKIEAGTRPGLRFREKGKRTWTNLVLLEQVRVLAERGAL